MDAHNAEIEPIDPIFRPRFVPSAVGQAQTNRETNLSLMAGPIIQAPPFVHPIRISKTMPTLQASRNSRMGHVVATPRYQLSGDNRSLPNNAVVRRTVSSTQSQPLQNGRMGPVLGQRNNDGTVRIGTIPITMPVNRPLQSVDIQAGEYPHFAMWNSKQLQPHQEWSVAHSFLGKIPVREIQQRSGQVTIRPAYINDFNNSQSLDDLDAMIDNGSVKFSITVEGRDFDVEMESTGDGYPDLECEICKNTFMSSDDRLRHEKTQHPGEKRADMTIIFNPMLYHAVQQAD